MRPGHGRVGLAGGRSGAAQVVPGRARARVRPARIAVRGIAVAGIRAARIRILRVRRGVAAATQKAYHKIDHQTDNDDVEQAAASGKTVAHKQ